MYVIFLTFPISIVSCKISWYSFYIGMKYVDVMFSKNSFHQKYLLQFPLISISSRDIPTRSNFPWDCPPVAAEAIPLKWKTQKIILWQLSSSQASHQINVRLCQDFDCNKTLSSSLLPNGPFLFGIQEKTFLQKCHFIFGPQEKIFLFSSPRKQKTALGKTQMVGHTAKTRETRWTRAFITFDSVLADVWQE